MENKIYVQNEYVSAYFFDPFFNSILFELQKKEDQEEKQFRQDFKIKNPNQVKISFNSTTSEKYWISEQSFTSDTDVDVLIDYIVKKERGNETDFNYLHNRLKKYHRLKTIGDILKLPKI